ncbi:hypothetical protein [Streptomyces sp. NPDC048445]|uniref:hypothetical protein n=1 Tax=Streptomyces sp. NPDC048445 TaxID=3365553 RepID=UPI00371BDA4E
MDAVKSDPRFVLIYLQRLKSIRGNMLDRDWGNKVNRADESTLVDVERGIDSVFVDVVDAGGDSMRREYGFIEFYFNSGQDWTISGGAIELHRLAVLHDLALRWRNAMHDEFPRYLAWEELPASYRGRWLGPEES